MEYNHRQAVADYVNVDFDIYRIRTQITELGSTEERGEWIHTRDRLTRKSGKWELEDDLEYQPSQLDRDVVAVDQIRTVVQTFRDKACTEICAGREHVPKTIIFAKDDSHADDIVRIAREEFGKGNDFCKKITYRTTGAKPEDLIAEFRNSFNPRIVVTVDMIATGTDIKPVEVVFFMRNVRSRNFFEQMKGRGVRTISPTDFNQVTPDAHNKDRFVILDAVGVTETELSDTYSLEREPTVPFDKLLETDRHGRQDARHPLVPGGPACAARPAPDIAGPAHDRGHSQRRGNVDPDCRPCSGHGTPTPSSRRRSARRDSRTRRSRRSRRRRRSWRKRPPSPLHRTPPFARP